MTISFSGTSGLTFPDNSTQATAASGFGFKNRIINGAMVIDARNAGASVASTGSPYTLDRWRAVATVASKYNVQQNAGAVTPPSGFINYLGVTSSSSYSVASGDIFDIYQAVEGLNIADLGWGSANAQTVTLSFWVRSSLTGTFGGSLRNNAADRSYPFSYTISAANTWEQKIITIAGDTSGTWLTTNAQGIQVTWGLGVGSTYSGTAGAWAGSNYLSATGATSVVGTNGATFYITGVQLEKGSTATSFDYRPYGTELALCQRYFYQIGGAAGLPIAVGFNRATSRMDTFAFFPVRMRATPTGSVVSGTNYYYVDYSQATTFMNSFSIDSLSNQGARLINTGLSGLTAGSGAVLAADNASALVSFSAEL